MFGGQGSDNRGHSGRIAMAAVLLTTTTIAGGHAAPAHAQSAAERSFNIPAQPLTEAIMQFGRQSGLQVTADTSLVAGKTSSTVSGNHAPAEALSRLLAGTGLTFRFTGATTIVLEPAPQAADGTVELGPVRVEGEAQGAEGRYGYAPGETSAVSPVRGFVAKRSATATKTDTPVTETPQSISIVTRDSLEARAVTNLRDAIEYVPGVTTRSYGEDDRYDWSTYRGFTIYNGAVYRDGLQDSGGQYAVPRTEIYGVERVEVLRGPASILFGNASPGAIVNIVSKRPTDAPRGEINLRAGSRDRYAIAADLSGPVNEGGTVGYRITALAERFDLLRQGADKDILYIQPSLSFQPTPDTSFTLFAQYQRERLNKSAYPFAYNMTFPERYRALPYYQEGYDGFRREQYAFWYSLEHRVGEAVTLRSVGRYSNVTVDYNVTLDDRLVGAVLQRTSSGLTDDMDSWAFDNQAQIDWRIGSGITNTTLVGVDVYRKKADFYSGTALTGSLNFDTGQVLGPLVRPVLMPNLLANYRQTGAYIQNQTKIGERLVLVGGLRHDWYRSRERGANASPAPARHDTLTGRIGIVWVDPSGFAPYASYSTSFQAQPGVSSDGTPFEPTTGRQYEVGLRYEPQNLNARFTAALFDIRRQNVLTPDPNRQNFSIQTGEVASRGIELEVVATVAERLNVSASYTYNKVYITKDTRPARVGLNIPMVPRQKATLWTDYTLPERLSGVNIGLGLRWNSRSWDTLNTLITPASPVLVDARVGYRTDRWELSVNAQNLVDKTYFVTCAFNDCHIGNPATITANLAYRW